MGILIDQSDSMNLIDGGKKRSDTINSIISGREFKKLTNRFNPVFCTFGGDALISKKGTIFLPENLAKSTNISLAFKKLRQSIAPAQFNAVLLFSDGNYNRGLNPVYMAKDMGCPVYTIAAGNYTIPRDLELVDLKTNEVAYAGTGINIEAEILSRGYKNVKVPLQLFSNNRLYSSKIISLSGNGELVKAVLSFYPKTPGDFLLKVSLPHLKGEYTYKNNFKDFKLKVLKSKIKVFMLSGSPNPDGLFIKRVLQKDPDVDVISNTFTKKGGSYEGSFPNKNDITSFDVVILNNVFNIDNFNYRKLYIDKVLHTFKGSFLVLQSLPPSKEFEKYFPFSLSPASGKYPVVINPSPAFSSHPILSNLGLFHYYELPPVYTSFNKIYCSLPLGNVLTGSSTKPNQKSIPVISTLTTSKNKNVFLWTQGFYTWALRNKTSSFFNKLVENTIRWLALRMNLNNGNVVLKTDRLNIQSSEEIGISCQLYDGLYKPVTTGSVRIDIVKNGISFFNGALTNRGNGIFSSVFRLTEPGTYSIRASGIIDGKISCIDTSSVFVSHFNSEFQNPVVDLNVLKLTASSTNGKFLSPDSSLNNFFNKISSFSFKKKLIKQIDFLLYPYLLILLIFLPVLEWFLRKKHGLL
ncbi:VWA domain-containing protein [bacterium]|nr:VWA domain-containing protein [bacterium]